MPHRPLVFVSGLTFGDYLLWNWSLNSNHDVLALVSGLTLPPLGVVCVWLLVLCFARMIGDVTRRRTGEPAIARTGHKRQRAPKRATTAAQPEETIAAPASAGTPSGKLAA